MPTSTTLWSPSSIDIIILTGAILAGCVAGASMFLCWLDKQVPSLPVMLSSPEPSFCGFTDGFQVDDAQVSEF